MKLYGKGEFDQARLKELLRDVEVRDEQLRLLLDSIEAQLSERLEHRQVAETTAAWLATLRDRVSEVEGNTEEAFSARRELVKLLVESIVTGRNGQGKVRVEITYRFGEPPTDPSVQGVYGRGAYPSTPGQGVSTFCQEFPWLWRRRTGPLRPTPKRCFWS